MTQLPKIIDNKRRVLVESLRDIAERHKHVSIATGYWDIEGTALILDHIKQYDKIRLLIGREPLLKRDNKNNVEVPEPDYPDEDFFEDLKRIKPSPKLGKVILTLKELIDSGRLEVRVYRRSFLHAKCYIFGDYTSNEAVGIIGSSNFTKAGLTENAELNTLEGDPRIVTFQPESSSQETGHLSWFNDLWNDEKTEEWAGWFIELLRTSPSGDLLYSPQELYLRTLHELYRDELEAEKEEIAHPHTYKLFEFQEKNVKNLTRILKTHGVAMLADSVGLGKTMSGIGVIKQYKNQRIVVVVPASLKEQWRMELAREGLALRVQVISLQNKQEIENARKIDEYAPVGLFVIDESHNLRSSNGTRYELLADWIASQHNDEAHVLLVTATPINNSLDDLTNQILLGARGDQDVFTIAVRTSEDQVVTRSFYEAVQNIKKRINQRAAQGATEDELMDIYRESRLTLEPVIQSFVVRNTRQSIKNLVKDDGTQMTFPDAHIQTRTYDHATLTQPPSEELTIIHQYSVGDLLETMDTLLHPLRQVQEFTMHGISELDSPRSTIYRLYQLILTLSFVPYRWRMYDHKIYGKTREELRAIRFPKDEKESINRQISLYGIIRTTFLKRLESSAYALEVSLERYQKRLTLFEDILEKQNAIANISDIDDILDEYGEDTGDEVIYSDEELARVISEQELPKADGYQKDALKEDIASEKKIITELLTLANELKQKDAKFEDFKKYIVEEHKKSPDKKILIFSFFSDTVGYLQEQFSKDPNCKALLDNGAFVSGATRTHALTAADRFSPIARKTKKVSEEQGELTYLFSTDVLSEGQNLQDAGHIINYDLHWNPVRMIQRNGRINRIGSNYSDVLVENYVPSKDLDEFLGLVERLRRKVELIKHVIGTDASVLGEDIDPRSYTGIYSTNEEEATRAYSQLESEAGSFAEDQFKKDLLDFYANVSAEERRKVERIPYGSWTVNAALESPDEVVTVASFTLKTDNTSVTKPFFFSNIKNGSELELLTRTGALHLIRSHDAERKKNALKIDTELHAESTTRRGAQLITFDVQGDAALTPTQKIVHEKVREHGWTPEEQDALHATLKTRNVLLQRKVGRLVRSINSTIKENKPTVEHYTTLKKLIREPTKPPEVTETRQCFGFTNS